jgi:EAL domain-containing protein (putative c-di-GMP-specific phosphodiesterase class I)
MVELTEGQPYPAPQSSEGHMLLRNIKELQRKGVLIAIDDYGKGFNVGEAIVSHLMPDILKIDKDVVQKPNEHKAVWSMVKSVLNGGKIKVVAEGIENSQDIDFVMSEGIRLCQGFYFGRPANL